MMIFPIDIKKIGGVAMHSRGSSVTASVVVLKSTDGFSNYDVSDSKIIMESARFPAVPTFEGFREGKILYDLLNSIEKPDILMINGHGIDHPRGFGLACHVGFSLDLPTIAISQTLLVGKVESNSSGNIIFDGKIVGKVFRSGSSGAPLYISPGYKVTLGTAVDIVKKTTRNKVPEPLKLARTALVDKIMDNTKDISRQK